MMASFNKLSTNKARKENACSENNFKLNRLELLVTCIICQNCENKTILFTIRKRGSVGPDFIFISYFYFCLFQLKCTVLADIMLHQKGKRKLKLPSYSKGQGSIKPLFGLKISENFKFFTALVVYSHIKT